MKKIICICLAALIFFTGCSVPHGANSNTVLEKKEGFKNSEPQNQSKSSYDVYKTEDNMWKYIIETANSVSFIPIAGAAVAAVCLDYESWRMLFEAF